MFHVQTAPIWILVVQAMLSSFQPTPNLVPTKKFAAMADGRAAVITHNFLTRASSYYLYSPGSIVMMGFKSTRKLIVWVIFPVLAEASLMILQPFK